VVQYVQHLSNLKKICADDLKLPTAIILIYKTYEVEVVENTWWNDVKSLAFLIGISQIYWSGFSGLMLPLVSYGIFSKKLISLSTPFLFDYFY